jgi:hypothetical protein
MGPKSWRMGFSRVISLDRIFFQSAKVLLSVVDRSHTSQNTSGLISSSIPLKEKHLTTTRVTYNIIARYKPGGAS